MEGKKENRENNNDDNSNKMRISLSLVIYFTSNPSYYY